MKANEAPEKIYLQEPTKVRTEKKYDNDVEYTRTDAFIEKAAYWLFNQANFYTKISIDTNNGGVYTDFYADKMVEDFKNYMKGE